MTRKVLPASTVLAMGLLAAGFGLYDTWNRALLVLAAGALWLLGQRLGWRWVASTALIFFALVGHPRHLAGCAGRLDAAWLGGSPFSVGSGTLCPGYGGRWIRRECARPGAESPPTAADRGWACGPPWRAGAEDQGRNRFRDGVRSGSARRFRPEPGDPVPQVRGGLIVEASFGRGCGQSCTALVFGRLCASHPDHIEDWRSEGLRSRERPPSSRRRVA